MISNKLVSWERKYGALSTVNDVTPRGLQASVKVFQLEISLKSFKLKFEGVFSGEMPLQNL